jgi:CDP-glycerol glycerophosphotransferase (TagB/SpsB family)
VKKLLFSLPYGIGFRNVVCCGIVRECLGRAARATVLIPRLNDEDRRQIVRQLPPGVGVEPLMPAHHSPYFTTLKLVKQHLYAKRTGLQSFRVKHDRRRKERPLLHVAASAIERAAERCCSEEWVDQRIARAPQRFEGYYAALLQRLQIDVVVLAKPGYQPEDLPLIKAARENRVPTVSVDTTWDNIVSKRPTYLAPDALTAWSSNMQHEAVRFYRLGTDAVPVTGGAAFDVFFDRGRLTERGEFLRKLRLDPSRKLIVFTLNNPIFNPQNPLYIRFLLEAVRRGAIQSEPNVVIRMHPWDRDSNHEELVRSYERVYLERPFGVPDRQSVYECIPREDDVTHYGGLMCHADVVVNIGSTTSLDAIAADTPVVNIAFDIAATAAELSAARFYDYSHYRPIVTTRAVRLVDTPEAFYAAVNAYLADRGLDREFRRGARRDFLTFSDGGSAARVADAITSLC